ncbi:MAG: pitrilysin family protein [Gammaproteobacteria bacterium]
MEAARRWYRAGSYTLEVHPFPEFAASGEAIDRSDGPPMPGSFPAVDFDNFERATLSNGMELIVAVRDAVPVVNFTLLLDAGYASDQFGEPGTSNLAMSMLDEGTKRRSALEISDELAQLGASLGAGSNLDVSTVSLNALSENLDDALDLYADVILNPSFPESDLARLKKQLRAQIQREKVTPVSMALRVFPKLMYGEGHAYSLPLTGSGTLESLERIDRRTLLDYHRTWFRPNNATMVVVGDTSMADIRPKLEKLFEDWEKGTVPIKNVAAVEQPPEEKIYLLDRPDSEQSIIFAGHILPPKANPDEFAIAAMNNILGGDFSARINMNLREDKNWSYGARSIILDAAGQRPFLGYAPVQTDKTAPSMAELRREMVDIVGERPPTEDELARVLDDNTLSLPGRWETAGAVAGSLVEMVRFGYDDDYWDTYAENVRGLSLQQVSAAADDYLEPDSLIWVVVGDRAKIESEIRALEIGEIVPIDADGNVIDSGNDTATN